MRIVIQRVINSFVKVDGKLISSINRGLNLLVGFSKSDYPSISSDFSKIIDKILNLRIFEDDKGKMNLSLIDVDGEVLLVSQFTLYGNIFSGRRPSFDKALEYDRAKELFLKLQEEFSKRWNKVKVGEFGAHMEVGIFNDGPVTFILDWEVKNP
ncbi:MAG: D-aminoacyl-tRNA deacylase [Candidatus Calescibacterium sp.]|nr:D-aminoacyl-tRNA deacylase [Candidatus Calescibacterium sp.]MCX7972160.1 D-aminoacyl-tRNA deacylase [bacterium]MDW8194849.1 D-aminoacyl-tRNA deacylase [Candidatus Calescibacterium sp.]